VNPLGIPSPAWLGFVVLVGALIGSFLNVCISRWPMELSVISPRSRCPSCQHPIAWYENIPVLSYIALRGRCRSCRRPISLQYPAVEVVVAIGWGAAFFAFPNAYTALRVAVLGTILLGIAVTDLQHYVIPDGFTVFGLLWMCVTPLLAILLGDHDGSGGVFATPYETLLGACVGAGAISIIGWLGEVALKRDAMGFGDVTLMAVIGAALGPARTFLTIVLGAALGAGIFLLIVFPITWFRSRRAGRPFEPPLVPFGVFLAPAAMISLLWGYRVLVWYLARMGIV
jgi:leader peptidase (prepilin peptidase) / N-methyltransferase